MSEFTKRFLASYNINHHKLKHMSDEEKLKAYELYIDKEIQFCYRYTKRSWFIAFGLSLLLGMLSYRTGLFVMTFTYLIMFSGIVRMRRYIIKRNAIKLKQITNRLFKEAK